MKIMVRQSDGAEKAGWAVRGRRQRDGECRTGWRAPCGTFYTDRMLGYGIGWEYTADTNYHCMAEQLIAEGRIRLPELKEPE
jgi:hypothetical protein